MTARLMQTKVSPIFAATLVAITVLSAPLVLQTSQMGPYSSRLENWQSGAECSWANSYLIGQNKKKFTCCVCE